LNVFHKLREPVNGLTHLAAAILSLFGLVALLAIGHDSLVKVLALFIYGCSLVLMFSASAAYHLVDAGPRPMLGLRKLDHTSIYFLIAGTYTPICLRYFSGFWAWGVLVIIWSLALVGIVVKLFIVKAPRGLTAGIYLVMGWLCLMAIRQMLLFMPTGALIWLLLGGLFFTVGAVVYIAKKPDFFPGVFGFHEVWHIFVILGCLSHYILIAAYVAPFPFTASDFVW
jgi:hemolysin III